VSLPGIDPTLCRVVLVEPETPKNVGFVARAMTCNSVGELWIVGKRHPHFGEAWITGVNSESVLENAVFCESLEEALAECTQAVGFSRRFITEGPPELLLPNLLDHLGPAGGETGAGLAVGSPVPAEKIALVFGRESTGLTADEVRRCTCSCAIPSSGNLSYNLGMAASIALYELVQKGADRMEQRRLERREQRTQRPTRQLVESLFAFLERTVDHGDPEHERSHRDKILRGMIERMEPDQREIQLLFGLFRSLAGAKARIEKGH
jgi:TrmH family RNA methyltransferase